MLVLGAFPLATYIHACIRFYKIQPYLVYHPGLDLKSKSGEGPVPHQEVSYTTPDGIPISAWYVPVENPVGVVLFCHGNAGNITQRTDALILFRQLGLSSFIFDYRGYGKSGGTPTEKGTYRDVEGAWDYLVNTLKVKPEELIVFGRSLGGAVAAYIAEKHPPRALVIESSFTSTLDMARRMFSRLLPIKLLMRFKYDTRKRLKTIHCPVMIIHSPEDETIPYAHGLALYQAANEPKVFLQIKGEHLHGFWYSRERYLDGWRIFLSQVIPNYVDYFIPGSEELAKEESPSEDSSV